MSTKLQTANVSNEDMTTAAFQPGSFVPNLFPYKISLIIVGVSGILANGLVFIGFGLAGRSKMNTSSAYIANHATLELFSCVARIVRLAFDLSGSLKHYGDSSPAGMAKCILIHDSTVVKSTIHAATFSVLIHTIDRFWKIVFPVHHRNHYRRWMVHVGLFLPWLTGFVSNVIPAILSTKIVNGICYPMTFWPNVYMEKVCLSRFRTRVFLYHLLCIAVRH